MSLNKGLYKLHGTNLVCNKLKHKNSTVCPRSLVLPEGGGGLST